MQVQDLKITDGKWTNDTGVPVELNPPGIVVGVNERIEVSAENGAIRVLPSADDEPIIAEQIARQREAHLAKLSPEDRAREEQRLGLAGEQHAPTTAETAGKADAGSAAQSSNEAIAAAADQARRQAPSKPR